MCESPFDFMQPKLGPGDLQANWAALSLQARIHGAPLRPFATTPQIVWSESG